ncbi:hypothetical protein WJX73_003969 [Symbiochloris irregularis]|uniref:MYND-type domain-containing protein n=1 Tax=Symbiochloris irregularis TaxID=706552 RepID=A0AAW1NP01_9CHLO
MCADDKKIETGDLKSLLELFRRTLAKVQGLSVQVRLDLSLLPRANPMDLDAAYTASETSSQYVYLRDLGDPSRCYNTYMSHKACLACLTAGERTASVLVYLKGIKQTANGGILIEAQFLCTTVDLPPECCQALDEARSSNVHLDEANLLDISLWKEILLSNAARLSPEYKHRCKREWGIEGSPFDVSFFAIIPNAQWDRTRTPCANESCSQPPSSHCARCKVAKYCSKEHLTGALLLPAAGLGMQERAASAADRFNGTSCL